MQQKHPLGSTVPVASGVDTDFKASHSQNTVEIQNKADKSTNSSVSDADQVPTESLQHSAPADDTEIVFSVSQNIQANLDTAAHAVETCGNDGTHTERLVENSGSERSGMISAREQARVFEDSVYVPANNGSCAGDDENGAQDNSDQEGNADFVDGDGTSHDNNDDVDSSDAPVTEAEPDQGVSIETSPSSGRSAAAATEIPNATPASSLPIAVQHPQDGTAKASQEDSSSSMTPWEEHCTVVDGASTVGLEDPTGVQEDSIVVQEDSAVVPRDPTTVQGDSAVVDGVSAADQEDFTVAQDEQLQDAVLGLDADAATDNSSDADDRTRDSSSSSTATGTRDSENVVVVEESSTAGYVVRENAHVVDRSDDGIVPASGTATECNVGVLAASLPQSNTGPVMHTTVESDPHSIDESVHGKKTAGAAFGEASIEPVPLEDSRNPTSTARLSPSTAGTQTSQPDDVVDAEAVGNDESLVDNFEPLHPKQVPTDGANSTQDDTGVDTVGVVLDASENSILDYNAVATMSPVATEEYAITGSFGDLTDQEKRASAAAVVVAAHADPAHVEHVSEDSSAAVSANYGNGSTGGTDSHTSTTLSGDEDKIKPSDDCESSSDTPAVVAPTAQSTPASVENISNANVPNVSSPTRNAPLAAGTDDEGGRASPALAAPGAASGGGESHDSTVHGHTVPSTTPENAALDASRGGKTSGGHGNGIPGLPHRPANVIVDVESDTVSDSDVAIAAPTQRIVSNTTWPSPGTNNPGRPSTAVRRRGKHPSTQVSYTRGA